MSLDFLKNKVECNHMEYYAHSGLAKYNIPPQKYVVHINNMYKQIILDYKILSPFLQKATLLAALFHDFGKLIPESQKILSQNDVTLDAKMVNHVDAGVAWCIREYEKTKEEVYVYAAYLIHAHHIGLHNQETLFEIKVKRMVLHVEIKDVFRDNKFNIIVQKSVKDYINETLDSLYDIQYNLLKDEIDYAKSLTHTSQKISPMDLRFALSVLIESDHGDTSRHYGVPAFSASALNPSLRIKKLEDYIKTVRQKCRSKGISEEVIESRNVLLKECSTVDVTQNSFFVCAAPTGKGKTFSLMKLSLKISEVKQKEKIFFIIPFTNIISQSVSNYRDSLVLDNENPQKIVNEIHSKVEFQNWKMRKYSHLWNSPINVSTSVQFFESLFSNRPSAVRKLMQFANSVIVFDEFHTSLPHHLWKIVLLSLKDISKTYNIDFIFGSGTHVYYWDIFDSVNLAVKEVVSQETFDTFKKFEQERITFIDIGMLNDDAHFYNEFNKLAVDNNQLKGNTIVVCNTVRNAVYMTKWFKKNTNWKIFHMSSYLTPADREIILKSIHVALQGTEKILLIATSVVECGIDFSFEIGFREQGSLMSTIQFGGRVNRNKEKPNAYVYEFQLNPQFVRASGTFSINPALTSTISARLGLPIDPDSCTNAIKNEISIRNLPDLVNHENFYRFRLIQEDFTVIDNLTISVIINKDIVDRMKQGLKVEPVEISRNSISIYRNKINPANANNWLPFVDTFNVEGDDVIYWVGPYDKEIYGAYAILV